MNTVIVIKIAISYKKYSIWVFRSNTVREKNKNNKKFKRIFNVFHNFLFPLNSSVIKNLVRTMVYKGHFVVCNYFVTLAYFSYFHNFSKPL
jgi:hypothetical protein